LGDGLSGLVGWCGVLVGLWGENLGKDLRLASV